MALVAHVAVENPDNPESPAHSFLVLPRYEFDKGFLPHDTSPSMKTIMRKIASVRVSSHDKEGIVL